MISRTSEQKITALRKALGYIQNGTEVTVKIFQDDATKDFHIEYGRSGIWAKSFNEVLDKLCVKMDKQNQTPY